MNPSVFQERKPLRPGIRLSSTIHPISRAAYTKLRANGFADSTGLAIAIHVAGSGARLARSVGVSAASVAKWVRAGRAPAGRVAAIASLTGVPAEALRQAPRPN